MTRDKILAMKAGRKLNILVSEKIMGNKPVNDDVLGDTEVHTTDQGESVYGPLPAYSEDIDSAQLVVTKMINLGYNEAQLWENEKRPDVICRAALLTILDREKEKKKGEPRPKLYVVK
jgi:hypothetical protein